MRSLRSILWVIAGILLAAPAGAVVLSEDPIEERSTEAGVIVRGFHFGFFGSVLDPGDANPSGASIADLRAYFSHQTPDLELTLHSSFAASYRTHQALGLLPLGRSVEPPRLLPLTWTVAEEPTVDMRGQVEWAYAAYQLDRITVSLGRQPVSLGRGRLWSPEDLVSTFALTEVDTEYKPGADALRLDWSPSSQTTLTALVAFGELDQDDDFEATRRGTTALAKLKHGFDHVELGLIGGLVRNDVMLGYDAFWDFGSFDTYGELTVTWVRDDSLSSPAVSQRSVPVMRALAGATLRPVSKVMITPELFYSGFGAPSPDGYLDVASSERVGIGEQTTLGQLYAGSAIDWEVHPLLHLDAAVVSNLRDPSALVSLGLAHDVAANARVIAGAYAPLGERPTQSGPVPLPQSEFGSYPWFGYLELVLAI